MRIRSSLALTILLVLGGAAGAAEPNALTCYFGSANPNIPPDSTFPVGTAVYVSSSLRVVSQKDGGMKSVMLALDKVSVERAGTEVYIRSEDGHIVSRSETPLTLEVVNVKCFLPPGVLATSALSNRKLEYVIGPKTDR